MDETTSDEGQQPGRATPSVSQDEDNEEEEEEEEEEEFDPTPKRAAPRRASRRQTSASVAEETPATATKPARRSRQSRQSKVSDDVSDASAADATGDVTPMKRSRRGRPRRSQAPPDEVSEASTISSTAEESTVKAPRHNSPRRAQGDASEMSMVGAPEDDSDDNNEADVTVLAKDPDSPSKDPAAPAKRRPDGGTPSGTPAPEVSSLPTPAPSQSPEPGQQRPQRKSMTPLADITKSANNQTPSRPSSSSAQDQSQSGVEMINPMSTVLEKPMDIVLKSRSGAQPPVVEQPAEPKPRMVITHLVLTNFKSYSGRQVVGPFHASFSSVVGPNGSGKSNVIDSLLFVFGFRASKMRQGKISALIHNSAQFPDLQYCEAEVHFHEVMDREDGGHDEVPESQLIIARRAFKNNSSKYYINEKEATFTTVTDLLRKRGIDLDHKRFLILQGEVESIAQMKSKAANEHDDGLLEYLEDIIGTSKYKTPIDEAAAEVENLNEVCTEKNNRVQHVEKEKSSLEDKKNKALAYIKDENELAEKLSMLYQIYIDECSDNSRVTEEAILQMQESLNLELEKHQGNEEGIKQLRGTYKKATKEYETMEKQTQAIVKEMAKYDKESVKIEEKRKFLAGKQKKLEKAIQSSKLAASECGNSVEKHVDDIEQKTAEITSLEKEMQHEEKELASIRDSLKGKTQGLSDQISAKQKSLEPWKEKINEKQSAVAVAQSELDILREKSNAGAVAQEEANAKVDSIKEAASAKTEELEQRHAEKGEVEKEVANLSHELQKFTHKESEYRQRLSTLRQKADEGRASLASTQNQGNVLSGLMRLKESGRIEGFHGRLGNLGTIDEKYDVAISTACPQLDNLVVDSVEVGQQCIDYLRKNNLGRANFILLDRLPRKDLSSIFTPDSVPRLFDLVTPVDDKFAPAFYSVLQNTLVAKDLGHANKIAYGARRWRVVTLDGQLIDVSGTMSGGGTRVARGGMSSKQVADVTQEQVAKLDQERDEFEKRYQSFQEKQRQLESSVKSKQDEIPKLDTRIRELQLEIESEGRNLADAQRRVKELAAEHKPSEKNDEESASFERRIASLNQEIEQLRAEMTGIEEEIQGLQDKIMEVGGVRLRSQKARVDGLKEQISLLTEEISNAEVSKSKNEKLRVKHEKTQVDSEEELQHVAKDLEKLNEDRKNQASAVQGTKEKTEEAQEVCRLPS